MFNRIASRSIQRLTRAFSQGSGSQNSGKSEDLAFTGRSSDKAGLPKFDPYEYNPFKHDTDKVRFLGGYSLQEVYSRRYAIKTSKVVEREMSLDTILTSVLYLVAIVLLYARYKSMEDYSKAYEFYQEHKATRKRTVPAVRPNSFDVNTFSK